MAARFPTINNDIAYKFEHLFPFRINRNLTHPFEIHPPAKKFFP